MNFARMPPPLSSTYFKDEGWKVGNADFGYKVDDAQVKYSTRLDTYRDLRNYRTGMAEEPWWVDEAAYQPVVTSYFRHEFQSAGGDAYRSLKLGIKADDGVVVYLNGTEIARNVPVIKVKVNKVKSLLLRQL